MKKVAIVVGSIVVIMVLLAGMFSAGLIVGNYFIPKGTGIAQPILDLPTLTKPEVHEPEVEEPTPSEDSIFPRLTRRNPKSRFTRRYNHRTSRKSQRRSMSIFHPQQLVLVIYSSHFGKPGILFTSITSGNHIDDDALMQGAIQGMITQWKYPQTP